MSIDLVFIDIGHVAPPVVWRY